MNFKKPLLYIVTAVTAGVMLASSLLGCKAEEPKRIASIGPLQSIYSQPHLISKHDNKIIISGVGDVTLGYRFNEKFRQIENELGEEAAFAYPFKNVLKYFDEDDVSIVNLEGTLTSYDKKRPKKFNFKGEPRFASCLNYGDIEAVNLANNHFMDYYEQGAIDTIDALVEHEILYCGGGKNIGDAAFPRVIDIDGIRIAFLGFAQVGKNPHATEENAGTLPYDKTLVKNQIQAADEIADIVVVSCHWGSERAAYPTEYQKNSAKFMIDVGADIIFGHHPHVLQGVELYNDGIIFYSLGNFAFGGNSYPKDKDSMIAQVFCNKEGVIDFRIIPVKTHPASMEFQPYVPDDTSGIENKIIKRSTYFNSGEIKFYR